MSCSAITEPVAASGPAIAKLVIATALAGASPAAAELPFNVHTLPSSINAAAPMATEATTSWWKMPAPTGLLVPLLTGNPTSNLLVETALAGRRKVWI